MAMNWCPNGFNLEDKIATNSVVKRLWIWWQNGFRCGGKMASKFLPISWLDVGKLGTKLSWNCLQDGYKFVGKSGTKFYPNWWQDGFEFGQKVDTNWWQYSSEFGQNVADKFGQKETTKMLITWLRICLQMATDLNQFVFNPCESQLHLWNNCLCWRKEEFR